MKFSESTLGDAILIEVEQDADQSGYFTRTMCPAELAAHGLVGGFVHSSFSYSKQRGALHGIHYQRPPFAGPQLVRCVRGAIHAVIVDMRPESRSYAQWEGFDLTERNGRLIYIPVGFAHGFQTLADDTEVIHQLSCPPAPDAAVGLRYDDPALAVRWPERVTAISPRDVSWPFLADERCNHAHGRDKKHHAA